MTIRLNTAVNNTITEQSQLAKKPQSLWYKFKTKISRMNKLTLGLIVTATAAFTIGAIRSIAHLRAQNS